MTEESDISHDTKITSETYMWGKQLPKIDLHRHLEGSLRLSTLQSLAQEYDNAQCPTTLEALKAQVQITNHPRNFSDFLKIFEILNRYYKSKKIIQQITREAVVDAARDHVHYLELRLNPVVLAKTENYALYDVVDWVIQAVDQAQNKTGIRTCLILQIPRREPLKIAEEIVEIAIALHGPFIRGVDLAGDEAQYPPEIFKHPFQRAFDAGLHITIHAGEVSGTQSIQNAVQTLHAQRIGHGIRSIESPDIIKLLLDRRITLEICPTSNIKTSIVSEYKQHPLRTLNELGMRITLNTDDPGIFDTTASHEIMVAVDKIGILPEHIYRFIRYSVDAAFIPPEEHMCLRDTFRDALLPFPGAIDNYNAIEA